MHILLLWQHFCCRPRSRHHLAWLTLFPTLGPACAARPLAYLIEWALAWLDVACPMSATLLWEGSSLISLIDLKASKLVHRKAFHEHVLAIVLFRSWNCWTDGACLDADDTVIW